VCFFYVFVVFYVCIFISMVGEPKTIFSTLVDNKDIILMLPCDFVNLSLEKGGS